MDISELKTLVLSKSIFPSDDDLPIGIERDKDTGMLVMTPWNLDFDGDSVGEWFIEHIIESHRPTTEGIEDCEE